MRGDDLPALPEDHEQDHSGNNIEDEASADDEHDWEYMEDGVEVDDELMRELLQSRCVRPSRRR